MTTRVQRRSRKKEEALADSIGGRRVAGSGNGWAVKNDVRNDHVSVEHKFTDKKSYSLKLNDLLTAERNALLDSGRDFVFILEMGGREWLITSRELGEVVLHGDPEPGNAS